MHIPATQLFQQALIMSLTESRKIN